MYIVDESISHVYCVYMYKYILYEYKFTICVHGSEVAALGLKTELKNFVTEPSLKVMCMGLQHFETKSDISLSL